MPPRRAYPRIRGGTLTQSMRPKPCMGLSPHTRGNRPHVSAGSMGGRPIPAYAGEPSRRCHLAPYFGGLSPHTRGNPTRMSAERFDSGPIPAYAGEPGTQSALSKYARAYPRIRGGTRQAGVGVAAFEGLSPHTRGNQWLKRQDARHVGPIPAYAGEPIPKGFGHLLSRAYPRIRGGTP